jgi:hypothetical protein
MTARALFAGPGAVRALVDGREGAVEPVFAGGAYVRLGSDYVFLSEPSMPFGPLSIAVARIGRLGLRPGVEVRVTRDSLMVGGFAIRYERVRERPPPRIGSAPAARAPAIGLAAEAALATLPDAPPRLRSGIAALGAGWVEDAVGLLAGFGEGLTPAGDDVLAGYAAARVVFAGLPPPVSALAAGRSSDLGLAYLRCAERGELPDPAARLLGAICRGSPGLARDAVAGLTSWGSSSGIALGWGATAAVCRPDP